MDKMLRPLQASMIVCNADVTLQLTGNGDCFEPEVYYDKEVTVRVIRGEGQTGEVMEESSSGETPGSVNPANGGELLVVKMPTITIFVLLVSIDLCCTSR